MLLRPPTIKQKSALDIAESPVGDFVCKPNGVCVSNHIGKGVKTRYIILFACVRLWSCWLKALLSVSKNNCKQST